MSLWKVAWRSIRQRALVSTLTVVSMGLGVALVVAVLVVYGVVEKSFHHGGEGYDLIVGAKGGKEQLVLNTVFYLSQPVGNIPYRFYEELTEGKYGRVETAIPVCMGHTYQGFRVVGTMPEMFTELKYRGDQSYRFAEGGNFKAENHFERRDGRHRRLSKPDCRWARSFRPSTDRARGGDVHKEPFTVVGILAPTGTPVDRAVFVNMLGFQEIHHPEDGGGRSERTRAHARQGTRRPRRRDEGNHRRAGVHSKGRCRPGGDRHHGQTDQQHARWPRPSCPLRVITDLFEGIVGKLQWILLGMAVLTVIEAGIGIMVSIYNSMSDRRHEIAVMRASAPAE